MIKHVKIVLFGVGNAKKHCRFRWQQLTITFVKMQQLYHSVTVL